MTEKVGRWGWGGAPQTSAHPNRPIVKVLNSWLHRSITSSLFAGLSTLYFSFSIHFMRDIYKWMAHTGVRGEGGGYAQRETPGREAGLKLTIQFSGQLRLSLWVLRTHSSYLSLPPCPLLPEGAWLTPRLGREDTMWSLRLRNVDRELFPQPSFWKRRARNRLSRGH